MIWTFLRSSAICCGVSGLMKSFSFRKSKNVDQPAVIVRAAEILEPGVALHVLGAAQLRVAARALGDVAILERRARDTCSPIRRNIVKRRARRELQVLARVEPDRLARLADIDLDLAADVAVERLWLHRSVRSADNSR